jgi:hypothetical protein
VALVEWFRPRRVVCTVAIAAQILVAAQLFLAPAVTVSEPRVSAAAAAPPSSVVADRPPPATPLAVDGGAIQRVLNRYRDAYSTMDVSSVRDIWPSVDADGLRTTFSRLAEQNLDYHGCEISGTGARAAAVCRGVVQARRAGSRRTITERHEWRFELFHLDGRWLIAAVAR